MSRTAGFTAAASPHLTVDAAARPAGRPGNPAVSSQLAGNRLGRLFCLTLFTPIRPQWVPVLRAAFYLGKYVSLAQTHILQFKFIRFVRWTIVSPDLPYNGAPQQRDKLRYHYLFFESNFDGPWQHYIDAFAYCIPMDIRFCWGRGFDFPAPPPSEPLKKWIAMNSLEGGSYYCAYEHASTRMVAGALTVRDRFPALVAQAQQLDAAAFKGAYEQFLTDVQGHL